MITLETFLAEYLKREGLNRILLEEHRSKLPIPHVWLAALWLSEILLIVYRKGIGGLLVAIFVPVILFLASFLLLAIFYAVRQWNDNKELRSTDAATIGGFFLFAFPLAVSLFVGIYLRSWSAALWYLLAAVLGFALIAFIQYQQHSMRMFFGLLGSLFKAMRRSVTLLIVLVPVLLVVVLLSVFSGELWDAIGSLALTRLILGLFLIALPAILLVIVRLEMEAKRIAGSCPDVDEIVSDATQIPFIREKLDPGFISQEEWSDAIAQLRWRDTNKLAEDILPSLRHWTKVWLVLLLLTTGVLLLVVFFVYFLLMFRTLLDAKIVADWMSVPIELLSVPLTIANFSFEFTIDSTFLPTMQVSLLLAVFISTMSTVYALTDDSFRGQFTEWLSKKTNNWFAAASLYLSIVYPNYQVWEYTRDDRRSGMINVSIVVPKELSEQEVRNACEHLDSQLKAYWKLIVITAFQQNPADPRYRLGIPGKRWQFIHNKIKETKFFEESSFEADDPRSQDYLGQRCLQQNEAIPDDWFGNTSRAVTLAKSIWESDKDHDLILHPYTLDSKLLLSFEIHLLKRMPKSDNYRSFIKQLLPEIQAAYQAPPYRTILITLCFRDTVDTLAYFSWNQEHGFIEYTDEFTDKSRLEKPIKWGMKK